MSSTRIIKNWNPINRAAHLNGNLRAHVKSNLLSGLFVYLASIILEDFSFIYFPGLAVSSLCMMTAISIVYSWRYSHWFLFPIPFVFSGVLTFYFMYWPITPLKLSGVLLVIFSCWYFLTVRADLLDFLSIRTKKSVNKHEWLESMSYHDLMDSNKLKAWISRGCNQAQSADIHLQVFSNSSHPIQHIIAIPPDNERHKWLFMTTCFSKLFGCRKELVLELQSEDYQRAAYLFSQLSLVLVQYAELKVNTLIGNFKDKPKNETYCGLIVCDLPDYLNEELKELLIDMSFLFITGVDSADLESIQLANERLGNNKGVTEYLELYKIPKFGTCNLP